jgi:histidine triad (HIT) family protein
MAARDDCIFCKILAGELPSHAVAENALAYAFADINPATRGHSLVIPRNHVADIHDISPEDLTACALLAKDVAGRAIERLGATGVNILHSAGRAAWQVVFHFRCGCRGRRRPVIRRRSRRRRPSCGPEPGGAGRVAALARD